MSQTNRHRPATAIAGASLVALWTGIGIQHALADTLPDGPRAVTVTAKDLDLSRPAGITTLYQRVWAAATFVCKPYNGDQPGSKVAWDSCRDATIADTIARFNVPALQGYYLARMKRPSETATVASQH